MNSQNRKPLLCPAAAQDKTNNNLAHLKQFYGLRKDIHELASIVSAITEHVRLIARESK